MRLDQTSEFVDDDGYPSDEVLTIIEQWPYDHSEGWEGLFALIESCWWASKWGWRTGECDGDGVPLFHVSTGGWSGNESIIGAMKRNHMFWSLHWVQSRRGGHYVFERPDRHADRRSQADGYFGSDAETASPNQSVSGESMGTSADVREGQPPSAAGTRVDMASGASA